MTKVKSDEIRTLKWTSRWTSSRTSGGTTEGASGNFSGKFSDGLRKSYKCDQITCPVFFKAPIGLKNLPTYKR